MCDGVSGVQKMGPSAARSSVLGDEIQGSEIEGQPSEGLSERSRQSIDSIV